MKAYGNRFANKSGCMSDEGFFMFAAQFGFGLLCWGMVLGPENEFDPASDPLKMMRWKRGGNILSSQITKLVEMKIKGEAASSTIMEHR